MAIAVKKLARGKYDMTISYMLPSRKYDMAHINLNSPRKQSLSVDMFVCILTSKSRYMTQVGYPAHPSGQILKFPQGAELHHREAV